jgi:hypothetical protein
VIGSTLLLALALAAAPAPQAPAAGAPASPASAADGGATLTVSLPRPGVYAAGVSFFAATPEPAGSAREAAIRYGDLHTLRVSSGTLPLLDAQVLVVNATPLVVPSVPVRVSILLGRVPEASLPPESEIQPGAARIQELPFFERTYSIKNLVPGGIGRVLISDIQIADAMKDQLRQKLWPVYLLVEARIEGLPSDVEAVQPSTSAFIRLVPR